MPVYHTTSVEDAEHHILDIVRRTRSTVEDHAHGRASEMLEVLENTAHSLLTGPRSGRMYRYAGGWYTASAPGELPAERSGGLRYNWDHILDTRPTARGFTVTARLRSRQPYAGAVQNLRPFEKAIVQVAKPRLLEISRQRWTR